MAIRTRIRQVARERGLTVAELARHLGLYRSNLSAMDRGRRSVSLRALEQLARFLNCSPADLLEVTWGAVKTVYSRPALMKRLRERDLGTPDGLERTWVHAALLAWQRHYRSARRLR